MLCDLYPDNHREFTPGLRPHRGAGQWTWKSRVQPATALRVMPRGKNESGRCREGDHLPQARKASWTDAETSENSTSRIPQIPSATQCDKANREKDIKCYLIRTGRS